MSNLTHEQIMRATTFTTFTLGLVLVAAMSSPARADVVTINFEGIPQGTEPECQSAKGTAPIRGYYNGDKDDKACGSRAGAQDLNVIFSAGALAITAKPDGPGGFDMPPSPANAAGIVDDALLAFTVSLEGGMLLSNIGFSYSAIVGSDPIVDLLFTDGNKRESFALPKCTTPEVNSFFCKWGDFNVDLGSGGKQVGSIMFSAALPNSVVFDNLSLTTPAITPVPEPSSIALAAIGLAVAAGLRRRRR